MQTFVQIINRVLRRLREDTVVNYNDTAYSTIIGDLVNETIADMQSIKGVRWNALLDDHTITTDGSSRLYSLSSSTSENSRDTNEQTHILGVYNDTGDHDLQRRSYQDISRLKLYTTESADLFWFREKGVDASGYRRVELYPEEAGQTVVVATYNPHGLIESSSTTVLLPYQVVTAGAYARAVDERGEDGGTAASTAFGLYNKLLGQALIIEMDRETDLEQDWRPE